MVFDLNGREQAILIWIAVLAIFFLTKREVRAAGGGLVLAFFDPKILSWVIAMLVLTAGVVAALHATSIGPVRLWEPTNFKTTVVWALTFALVTMFDVNRLADERGALTKLFRQALSPMAWVVFVGTLNTFSVWVELILVPLASVLALMLAIAEGDKKSAILVRPLQYLIAFIVLSMMGHSLYEIVTDFSDFAKAQTFREFIVPIVLTMAFLPFLYAMTIVMAYETAFVTLKIRREDPKLWRYAAVRTVLAFGLNRELLRRFKRDVVLRDAYDRQAIRTVISDIKRLRKRELDPPPVAAELGWSPYVAGRFLEGSGLAVRDYHYSIGEWFGESQSIRLGDGAFSDQLVYSVGGTETAATNLTLRLNCGKLEPRPESEQKFEAALHALVSKLLGPAEAERAIVNLRSGAGRFRSADGLTFTASRNEYGNAKLGGYERRLKVRHPADEEWSAE